MCICVHHVHHPAAIHEFPEDIFTKEQRKKGAVCLHALCVSMSRRISWHPQTPTCITNQQLLYYFIVWKGSLCTCTCTLSSGPNCAFRPSTCSMPWPSSVTTTSSHPLRKYLRWDKRHRPAIRYHFVGSMRFIFSYSFLFWASSFFFVSFRTCSSVRMWPVRHSWRQAARLQSFLPLSLVSSLANRDPVPDVPVVTIMPVVVSCIISFLTL